MLWLLRQQDFPISRTMGIQGWKWRWGENPSRSEEVKPIAYEITLIHLSFTFSQEVDVLQINDGNLKLANICSSVGNESAYCRQETWVQCLGQEDPLEKEIQTTPVPGKSYGQRRLVDYSPLGRKNRTWLGD